MSTIKTTSWHYKIVSELWQDKTKLEKSKACTYYWLKLPLSLLAITTFGIFIGIVIPIGWFCGNTPDIDGGNTLFYPHMQHSDGRPKKFAPWHIGAVIALLGVFWYSWDAFMWLLGLWQYLAIAILTLMCLGIVGYMATSSWKSKPVQDARRQIANLWSKACPTIKIVESDEPDNDEQQPPNDES